MMNFKRKLVTGLLGLATLCGCLGACIFYNSIDKQVSEVKAAASTYIHFNKQGGHGGWDYNNPQSYGQPMNCASPLASLIPSRNGCTFLGYFDAPSGGTRYYYSTGQTARNWDKNVSETTLYAQWSPSTYLVTFDKQGGTGGSDSSYISNFDNSTANNDQITIPQNTGCSFYGYFDQPNGQGNQVYNSIGEFIKGSISTYSSKTLYAYWSANHVHDNILFLPWTSNNSLPTSGSFYLTSDVTISQRLLLENSTNLNLCLNGFVIIASGTNNSVIHVDENSTLNIYDDSDKINYFKTSGNIATYLTNPSDSQKASAKNLEDLTNRPSDNTIIKVTGGAITGGQCNNSDYGGGGILIKTSTSKFNLYGGAIIGNVTSQSSGKTNGGFGGGVDVRQGGSFNMYNGIIAFNSATQNGGGLFIDDGSTATLHNGIIANNYCGNSGGGVAVDPGSTFLMKDGTIKNNKTNNYDGGGVVVESNGTFTLNNGSILNNFSQRNGGGVKSNGTIYINDGIISYNQAAGEGGGIYSTANSTINGGTISHNTVTKNGGGVNINSGSFILNGGTISYNETTSTSGGEGMGGGIMFSGGSFTMNGGTISHNTAKRYGGGVGVRSGATFNMNGGSIINNIATTGGGGGISSDGSIIIKGGANGATIQGNTCGSNQGKQLRNSGGSILIKDYCTIDNGENDLYQVTNNLTKTKLVLNKQGGIGGDGYIDAIYNQQIPNLTAIPIKTGYTFNGYYTGSNGTGTKYYNANGGRAFTNNWNTIVAEINLYAYWTANSYAVVLDAQGGEGGTTSITPTYDAEMPEMTIPSREYCDFGGYFTGINGDGTKYYNADGTSARSWNIDSDTTLYAYWTITLENFSTQFIKLTDGFCDYGGKIEESTKSTLKASFDLMSDDDIASFKILNPVTGIREFPPEQIVLNAKSRYCYLISDWKCDDFLGLFNEEELKALMHRGSIVSLFNDGEDGTSIILVASLSILTITTISAYILFRKRKEE